MRLRWVITLYTKGKLFSLPHFRLRQPQSPSRPDTNLFQPTFPTTDVKAIFSLAQLSPGEPYIVGNINPTHHYQILSLYFNTCFIQVSSVQGNQIQSKLRIQALIFTDNNQQLAEAAGCLIKPEAHLPDEQGYNTTLRDETRSGTDILIEPYHTYSM